MIEQHVEFVGLDPLFAGFTRIDRGLSSLRPLWELYGKEFYLQETAWFASQPWVALSPRYAEEKQKRFGSKPILRALDDLFRSLTQQGAAGNIHQVSDLSAIFGTSDPKAPFHHSGTSRMPARDPFAPLDTNRYESIAGNYLVQMVTGAFG